MEKPFNGTFFATVAVILPVIFLALALQSDYIARTFLAYRELDRMSRRQQAASKRKTRLGRTIVSLPAAYLGLGLFGAAFLVIFDGTYGEIVALRALEQQQAGLGTQSDVMQSVVVLIVAAAVASAWRVVETFRKAETKSTVNNGVGDPPAKILRVSRKRVPCLGRSLGRRYGQLLRSGLP